MLDDYQTASHQADQTPGEEDSNCPDIARARLVSLTTQLTKLLAPPLRLAPELHEALTKMVNTLPCTAKKCAAEPGIIGKMVGQTPPCEKFIEKYRATQAHSTALADIVDPLPSAQPDIERRAEELLAIIALEIDTLQTHCGETELEIRDLINNRIPDAEAEAWSAGSPGSNARLNDMTLELQRVETAHHRRLLTLRRGEMAYAGAMASLHNVRSMCLAISSYRDAIQVWSEKVDLGIEVLLPGGTPAPDADHLEDLRRLNENFLTCLDRAADEIDACKAHSQSTLAGLKTAIDRFSEATTDPIFPM